MSLPIRSEDARKKALKRAGALKRRYGITPEQYDKMLERQGGKCAICRRPPGAKRLAVDHDHKTKRVRGALCYICNKYKVAKNDVISAMEVVNYLLQDFDGRLL
jgi:hypothetical protein